MKYTIYKCYCIDKSVSDFYIGSTTDLVQRINFHRVDCLAECNRKIYISMRANGGFDNWAFESLENGECETRTEIRMREQHYMNELKPTLNQVKAYLTKEEKRLYTNGRRAVFRAKYPEKQIEWNTRIAKWKWRCDVCDHDYPYTVKARHLKTKKHQDNINGVERGPRTSIREDTTRCDETQQTPQKKSLTEQEYLEVLQNPDNYNIVFELCGECRT